MYWQAIEAIATSIEVLVVIGAAFFAVLELREISRSRSLEAVNSLISALHTEEARRARRTIYSSMPEDPTNLSGKELEAVEQVLTTLDKVGFLVERNLLPRKLALDLYSGTITRIWRKADPYVQFERKRRRASWYLMYAEKLATEAEKHVVANFPDDPPAYYYTWPAKS